MHTHRHKFKNILVCLLIALPLSVLAAERSGWAEPAENLGSYSGCANGFSLWDAVAKEYDTSVTATVPTMTLRSFPINFVAGPPGTVTNGTPITDPLCAQSDTQALSVEGPGDANYYDCGWCGFEIVGQSSGRHLRMHVHFKPTSIPTHDMRHVFPVGGIWLNYDPDYQFELMQFPRVHGASGIKTLWLAAGFPWKQFSRSGQEGIYTLPRQGKSDGFWGWDFAISLNGGTAMASAVPLSNTDNGESFGIDRAAPALSVAHLPLSPDSNDTIVVNATAQDTLSGLATTTVYFDGVLASECTYNNSTSVQVCNVFGLGPFAAGSVHSYYAVARDRVRNQRTSPTQSFTVSRAPPVVTVAVAPAFVTATETFRVTMTSVDAATCTWSRSGTYSGNWSNQPVPAPNVSYDSGVIGPWGAGNATWTFTCTNSGGSTSASASVVVADVDIAPQNLILSGPLTVGSQLTISGDTMNRGATGMDTSNSHGLVRVGGPAPITSYSYAVDVSGNYAYTTSSNGSAGNSFEVFNVADKANPSRVSGFEQHSHADGDVAVLGTYAYVTHNAWPVFEILNISNPLAPSLLSTGPSSSGLSSALALLPPYAFLNRGSTGGIQIYNISNPSAPTKVANGVTGFPPNTANARGLAVSGSYAYLVGSRASGFAGGFLEVFDVSNPATPLSVAQLTFPEQFRRARIYGNHLYASHYASNGFSVFDITTDPSMPTRVAQISTDGLGDMRFSGRYLYGGAPLVVYDIVDAANPVRVESVFFSGGTANSGLFVSPDYVYSASGDLNIFAPHVFSRFCVDNLNCASSTVGRLGGKDFDSGVLGAGGAYATTTTWLVTAGVQHTIYFCTDVRDTNGYDGVAESDETNNCTSQTFTVNMTPSVNAGPDLTIALPTNSVNITGASASDSDGSIAGIEWTFVAGPTVPTIVNGSTLTPTITGLSSVGAYLFKLTATDNSSATATDELIVDVYDQPDLVATEPTPSAATPGVPTVFSSNIINQGVAATDAGAPRYWSVSRDLTDTIAGPLAVDSAQKVLYVGTSNNGIIYRCDLATHCDSAADWKVALDSPESEIRSLLFDSANNILYAGTALGGLVYRCETTLNCDETSDWVLVFDSPITSLGIRSMTVDTANQVLYAAAGYTDGIIYRCVLSSGCDSASEWEIAFDTTESQVYAIKFEPVSGVLYAGTYPNGYIYRCPVSLGCNEPADWTIAYNTPESSIYSFAVDDEGGIIYAGSAGGGIIYRCALSSGCDSASEWTRSYDTTESEIRSLTFSEAEDALYGGSYPNGYIYRCRIITLCDTAGDWTLAFNTPQSRVESFASTDNILYVGTGNSGLIYRFGPAPTFQNFFQIASGPGGSGTITDLAPSSMPHLVGGGSETATSPAYTFATAGTYSVRACADKSSSADLGIVTESNENNNCSDWVDVTVASATPSPTVSVTVTPASVNSSESFTLTMTSTDADSCTWSRTSSYGGDWTDAPIPTSSSCATLPCTSYDSGPLTFAPGNATWTFTCTNATGDSPPVSGSVTVTGVPALAVTPPQQNYGDVFTETTDNRSFTVTNTGTPGSVLYGTATSDNPAYFTCVAGCDYSGTGILEGTPHTVTIRFAPGATLGLIQGNITFTGTNTDPPVSLSRPVLGNGVLPIVATNLSFGDVLLARSKDLTLTVTNYGSTDYGPENLTLPADFACVAGCPLTLTPGEHTMTVRFTPSVLGNRGGTAWLLNHPTITFQVTGTGVPAVFQFRDQ